MGRRYGTGFVAKGRTKWRAFIPWTDDFGRSGKLTKMTGIECDPKTNKGKALAETFLRQWHEELIREPYVPFSPEANVPFAEYAREVLDTHEVSASTRKGYRTSLRRLIGTEFGNCPVGKVTPDIIARWEHDLREDGQSASSIQHHHAFASMVMKRAVYAGLISRNPFGAVRAPRATPKPTNSMDSALRERCLLRTREMLPDPFAVAVQIALLTGMRRGEICALRWQDVDLDHRMLYVNHAVVGGDGFKLGTPKDPTGKGALREVPIGGYLCQLLAETKQHQSDVLREFSLDVSPGMYVVGNPIKGTFMSPDVLTKKWGLLVKVENWRGSQGEYLRFHDLRHTFATLAIKDKVMDIMALSRILGHKDVSMTLNTYSDALQESKRTGMDALDATLFSIPEHRGDNPASPRFAIA